MNKTTKILSVFYIIAMFLVSAVPAFASELSFIERISVAMNSDASSKSVNTYEGSLTMTVMGTGQSSGTAYSDPIYVYTDADGNGIEIPYILNPFLLCLNGRSITSYMGKIPAYSSSHMYQITILLDQPTALEFKTCDQGISDNSGSYIINIDSGSIVAQSKDACYDSDGGKDYYTYGTASGVVSGYASTVKDGCVIKSQGYDTVGYEIVTSCSGTNCVLQEAYCDGQPKSEDYNCPESCRNGACVKEQPTNVKCELEYYMALEKSVTCYVNYNGKSANCVIPASSSYGHQCTPEPIIMIDKPVPNEGFQPVPGLSGKFSGIECSEVETAYNGDYYFVNCKNSAPSVCKDSDGGADYFVAGTTTSGTSKKTDSCTYCTGLCNMGKPCVSTCGAVEEFYCAKDGVSIISSIYTCPNGCSYGACIQSKDPIAETVSVSFVKNGRYNPVSSQSHYKGTVALAIKGTGQASASAYSDPLYVYTDYDGNEIEPQMMDDFMLCLNDKPIKEYLVSIPGYNNRHGYEVSVEIPEATQLKFSSCDGYTSDNSGSYTVNIKANPVKPSYECNVDTDCLPQSLKCGGCSYACVPQNIYSMDKSCGVYDKTSAVECPTPSCGCVNGQCVQKKTNCGDKVCEASEVSTCTQDCGNLANYLLLNDIGPYSFVSARIDHDTSYQGITTYGAIYKSSSSVQPDVVVIEFLTSDLARTAFNTEIADRKHSILNINGNVVYRFDAEDMYVWVHKNFIVAIEGPLYGYTSLPVVEEKTIASASLITGNAIFGKAVTLPITEEEKTAVLNDAKERLTEVATDTIESIKVRSDLLTAYLSRYPSQISTNPVCGNSICEEKESSTCPDDCRTIDCPSIAIPEGAKENCIASEGKWVEGQVVNNCPVPPYCVNGDGDISEMDKLAIIMKLENIKVRVNEMMNNAMGLADYYNKQGDSAGYQRWMEAASGFRKIIGYIQDSEQKVRDLEGVELKAHVISVTQSVKSELQRIIYILLSAPTIKSASPEPTIPTTPIEDDLTAQPVDVVI